ncbi:hypothetical protein [Fortiea contorta]|uniref:hypothetical protein n=1 Tax=Fortiea contorta TaxID=1892405 RepID=UPI0012B560BC|nr:hypothetical protein [Fortiea contorta]
MRDEGYGAGRNTFEGYDNWNVDRVTIATPRTCVEGIQLLNQTRRPLVRFTGGDTSRRFTIKRS